MGYARRNSQSGPVDRLSSSVEDWIRGFPRHGDIDAHRLHETIARLEEAKLTTTDQRHSGVIIEQHVKAVASFA